MILLFGSSSFGEVDKTPEVGSVSTEFFHIYYCPIVPLGSYFAPTETGAERIRLRLSWKSVFVAWSRAALIFFCATFAILAALEFADGAISNGLNALTAAIFTLVAFDFLRSTRGIGRATEKKAAKLLQIHQAIQADRADGWRTRIAA